MFSGRFEILILCGIEVCLLENEDGGWHVVADAPAGVVGFGERREDAMRAFLRQLEERNVVEQISNGTSNETGNGISNETLDKLDALSPRQKQVLVLTAEGKDPRQVAEHLGISPKTVETFVNGINKKLGTRSRLQAVIYYYQARLRELGAR